MKIKIKISIEHLSILIDFVKRYMDFYNYLDKDEPMQYINLKGFVHFGMKKIITASENSQPKNKVKTISFDVNQINATYTAMFRKEADLCPLLTALYNDIYIQTSKQLRLTA